jgi:hypothetical protein
LLPLVDLIIRTIIHTAILRIGTNLMRVSLPHSIILVILVAIVILAADFIAIALR